MRIQHPYQKRPVRFVGILQEKDWRIKLYSICVNNEYVSLSNIALAKKHIGTWLQDSTAYGLETYKIATLIIHEGREGCFAIINWWTGENMLQNMVYLLRIGSTDFELFSDKGITTCVWEMAVLWHERNAWVKHVLMQHNKPDFAAYLKEQLNDDI